MFSLHLRNVCLSGGSFLVFCFFLCVSTTACTPRSTDPSCIVCNPNDEKCSPDRKGIMTCKNIQATGCWQFVLQRCQEGLFCTSSTTGGRLSCQQKGQGCTVVCGEGQKRCEGETVVVCQRDPATDCTQWFPEQVCSADKPCQNGICGGAPCTPTNPQHETKCVGNAVHWFDDCGRQGLKKEDCQTPAKCVAGACKSDGPCTQTNPQQERKCVGNAVYWFDNCGTQGAFIEQCQGTCANGACAGCTQTNPQQERKCVGNAVHWFDNCGTQGALIEQCQNGATCQNGKCEPPACTPSDPQKERKCVGNDIYWFDDCGKQRNLIETCSGAKKCANGGCVDAGCQGGTNVCTASQARCNGNSVEFCQQNPNNGCYEWSAPLACGSGQICQGGVCVQDPNGGGNPGSYACKTGFSGICSKNTECCHSGQSCRTSPIFIKLCGPCHSSSDCPKDSIGIPLQCCGAGSNSFCASICP